MSSNWSMKITVLGPEKMSWSIGGFGSIGKPSYHVGLLAHSIVVHPRPAYVADPDIVRKLLDECAARFPLEGSRGELTILSHEFEDSFNGLTWRDPVWRDDEGKSVETVQIAKHRTTGEPIKDYEQSHQIAISAKPIPYHPAMLRYLIPHEYGHAVVNHVRPRLGYDASEMRQMENDYLTHRGTDLSKMADGYSSGKWHISPGEIMANDFRILVMEKEPEFWPHPGIEFPSPSIMSWWRKAAQVCGVDL